MNPITLVLHCQLVQNTFYDAEEQQGRGSS
nr:hypothetical protein [Tanacetum cinerariifolium]